MQYLPFGEQFSLITCLFDSVNFLIAQEELQRAFNEFARVLRPGGLLYFDVVTERMVLKHFVGPEWSEEHAGFETVWYTYYNKKSRVAQTHVRVGTGPSSVIVECMHPLPVLVACLERAGLEVLARFDVEGHRAASGRSCRVDFIAVKPKRNTFPNRDSSCMLTFLCLGMRGSAIWRVEPWLLWLLARRWRAGSRNSLPRRRNS
jgi:SAM-dependent methyltransferase